MSKTTERLNLILSLRENSVDLSLLQEYDSDTLYKLCEGIEKHKIKDTSFSKNIAIQKELINDERFFIYLDKFAAAKIALTEINLFLSELHSREEYGMDYPIGRLISSMILTKRSTALFYDYLKYFSGIPSDKEQKSNIISNLDYFSGDLEKPVSELTDKEKSLFMESCLTNRPLIPDEFARAFALLQQNDMLEILRFINKNEYDVSLSIDNYEAISKDAGTILRYFKQFHKRFNNNHMELLMVRWLDNNCHLHDLDVIWSKADELDETVLDEILNDRSGYVNLIYGNTINDIPLAIIPRYKEDILIHAIAQEKSDFLRLIYENKALFESVCEESILFSREFYAKHFDINTMNAEDLDTCIRMDAVSMRFSCLEYGRCYTFNEIKALYGLPAQYYKLYEALTITPIDRRLFAFKELSDNKLLALTNEDECINKLATKLSLKPLTEWLDNEFAHIEGFKMLDAAQLLVYYDEVMKLVPQLQSPIEAKLLIRNRAIVQNYGVFSDIKKDINVIDSGLSILAAKLSFDEGFLSENQEPVYEFLCKGNAEIVNTYYENLDDDQKKLFRRIVEAELTGGLSRIKYNAEDLCREADYPVNAEKQSIWQENTDVCIENIIVNECDDFNSTMILGEIPSKSNLSYIEGSYCECLLSGFDSNKKVLFASVDNKNVSRAVIRLTKGKFKMRDGAGEEKLVLFLERSYSDGISDEIEDKINDMYFELMDKKAKKMGAMLILSDSYGTMERPDLTRGLFNVFISKSKAGAQYLDSLNGRVRMYDEGGYRTGSFIVRMDDVSQNDMDED